MAGVGTSVSIQPSEPTGTGTNPVASAQSAPSGVVDVTLGGDASGSVPKLSHGVGSVTQVVKPPIVDKSSISQAPNLSMPQSAPPSENIGQLRNDNSASGSMLHHGVDSGANGAMVSPKSSSSESRSESPSSSPRPDRTSSQSSPNASQPPSGSQSRSHAGNYGSGIMHDPSGYYQRDNGFISNAAMNHPARPIDNLSNEPYSRGRLLNMNSYSTFPVDSSNINDGLRRELHSSDKDLNLFSSSYASIHNSNNDITLQHGDKSGLNQPHHASKLNNVHVDHQNVFMRGNHDVGVDKQSSTQSPHYSPYYHPYYDSNAVPHARLHPSSTSSTHFIDPSYSRASYHHSSPISSVSPRLRRRCRALTKRGDLK
jgi:hypothetical protein